MRIMLRIVLIKALLLLALAATGVAQAPGGASAEELRGQLRDVEAKEAELQERVRQLDEALKPENIERSLALTGSTKPEELRERRRRQLESEKEKVRVQLDELARARTRLGAAIASADAEAYRRSAQPITNSSTTTTASSAGTTVDIAGAQPASAARKQRRRATRRRNSPRRPRRRNL